MEIGETDTTGGHTLKQEKEQQQLLEEIKAAPKLIVICKRFVYPEWNRVQLPGPKGGSSITGEGAMSMKELFTRLGIEDNLKDVYQHKKIEDNSEDVDVDLPDVFQHKDVKGEVTFTGLFTKNGRQNLANLLDKTIEFYNAEPPGGFVEQGSKQVFKPKPIKV